MTTLYWPYSLAMALATVLALGVSVYAFRRKKVSGALPFAWMMALVSFWALTNAIEVTAVEPSTKIFWSKLAYLAITNIPPLWLLFALRFSGRNTTLNGPSKLWMWIIPVVVVGMVFTNEQHGLIWTSVTPFNEPGETLLVYRHGAGLFAWTGYAYILLLSGTLLLIWTALASSQLYRRQILIILVGALIPWAGNILYILKTKPFILIDITPVTFAITGLVFMWGAFRMQILDLIPVARHTVVEGMQDGVLVLDVRWRVVDINPAAVDLLGLQGDQPVGRTAGEIMPFWSSIEPALQERRQGGVEVRFDPGRGVLKKTARWLEVNVTSLSQRGGRQPAGHLVILRDSTGRKQSEINLRKLSSAVESSPVSIVITNLDGEIEYVNQYFTQLTGYTAREALGENPNLLKSGITPPDTYRQMWNNLKAGKEWRGEFINRKKNGEIYWEEAVIAPVFDSEGCISSYVAVKEDISDRVRAENEMREQRALAEALRDTADALNSTLNLEEVLDRILANIGRVVPYDASHIVLIKEGKAHIERHRGLTEEALQQLTSAWVHIAMELPEFKRVMETRQPMVVSDARTEPSWAYMDEMAWVHSKVTVPLLVEGQIIGFLNLYSRKPGYYHFEHASRLQAFANQASTAIRNARLFSEVERLATVDPLTGLYNRRSLFEIGKREILRVQRFKRPLSALFVDIDHFKRFNDRYSYAVGDQMLQAVSNCLRTRVRDLDLVCRYGGEEIVLLLPELDLKGAIDVAERLRDAVEKMKVQTIHGDLAVTVSIGVATFSIPPGQTAQLTDHELDKLNDLIDLSGQMLHDAKNGGRNRVRYAELTDDSPADHPGNTVVGQQVVDQGYEAKNPGHGLAPGRIEGQNGGSEVQRFDP